MAHPNPQLEAALAQFAQQPGVTPDQTAQLRAAVTADAQLLQQLNQDAQTGHLCGFALQSPSNTAPSLIGTYDMQIGIVTLPATSFVPTGTTPSADLKATVKLQHMSMEFAHSSYQDAALTSHAVTQDMVNNLQATLNGSPVMAQEIKRAATTADPGDSHTRLEKFGFVGPGIAAGGTYDGQAKSMNLPPLGLQSNTPTNTQGSYNAKDLTFVLGHEIQHSFNHADKRHAENVFSQEVQQVAASAATVHDYTAPIGKYIQASREDEAKAEIAGWNALLSREKQLNPNVDLTYMLKNTNSRVLDFVQKDPNSSLITALPLPGLTFNPDSTLSQTPANIAAMGQHYFDRPAQAYAQSGQRPVGLGESHKTDYTNYYGTYAVETCIAAERQHAQHHPSVAHRMTINMASLGLKEDLMEQEGINFTINKATPQPYYDSTQTPATLRHFNHTQDGSVNAQHDHQHVPITPQPAPLRADQPGHPDHPAFESIRSTVRADGRWNDEQSANIAAALLREHKADPACSRLDRVVVGLPLAHGDVNIFAVHAPNGLQDLFFLTHVSAANASQVPAERNLQQVEQLNQQQAPEHVQAQQLDAPAQAHRGPGRSM